MGQFYDSFEQQFLVPEWSQEKPKVYSGLETDEGSRVEIHRVTQGGVKGLMKGQIKVKWVCWKVGSREVEKRVIRSWEREKTMFALVQVNFTMLC